MQSKFISVITRTGSSKVRFLALPESKLPQNLKPLSPVHATPNWTKLSNSFSSLCSPGYTAAYRVQSVGLTGHKGIRDGVYDMDIFKVQSNSKPTDNKRRAYVFYLWCLVNFFGFLGLSIELNGLCFGQGFSLDQIDISATYGPFRFSERVQTVLEGLSFGGRPSFE